MAQPNNDYDVAAERQKILEGWNPAPTDEGLRRLLGENPPEGDTRATAAVNPVLGHVDPTSDKVDAKRMDLYRDDASGVGDGEDDLDDMDKATLQEEAEKRGLAKSGSKDDLKARIREHDASDGDDDEGDEDEG